MKNNNSDTKKPFNLLGEQNGLVNSLQGNYSIPDFLVLTLAERNIPLDVIANDVNLIDGFVNTIEGLVSSADNKLKTASLSRRNVAMQIIITATDQALATKGRDDIGNIIVVELERFVCLLNGGD